MFVADTSPGRSTRSPRSRRALAGAETNVATGLARLGHRTGWIGRVGDDPFGRFIAHRARRRRHRHHRTSRSTPTPPPASSSRATPTAATRRSSTSGATRPAAGWRPRPASDAYIAAARHLHVTGIPLALSASARDFAFRAVDVARAAGATVSFDPNLRPTLWAVDRRRWCDVTNEMAARADWVLPGLSEGQLLTGRHDADGSAAFYLEQGAVQRRDQERGARRQRPSPPRAASTSPSSRSQVVDTVGAGDGFAAGLISGYLDGLDLPAAACAGPPPSARSPPPAPGTRTACPTGRSWTRVLAGSSPVLRSVPDDGWSGCRSPSTGSRSRTPSTSPRSVRAAGRLDRGRHVAGQAVRHAGRRAGRRRRRRNAGARRPEDRRRRGVRVRPRLRRRCRLGDGARPGCRRTLDTAVRVADERGREVVVDLMELPPARRAVLAARLPAARRPRRARRARTPRRRACARSTCSARGPTAAGWRSRADSPLPTCPRSRTCSDVRVIVGSAVTKADDPVAAVQELRAATRPDKEHTWTT